MIDISLMFTDRACNVHYLIVYSLAIESQSHSYNLDVTLKEHMATPGYTNHFKVSFTKIPVFDEQFSLSLEENAINI